MLTNAETKSIGIVMVCLMLATNIYANTPPVVSNVTAAQREDNSNLVDILYDLTDADGDLCSVWVVASHDGGVSWQVMPKTVFGDVWANVSPGTNRSITWDAGADMPGVSRNFKVRVFADDGNCFTSMCYVPYDAESGYSISNFWIGKYEVTNLQYCEYLNRGNPDSHWSSDMEITRTGTYGDYVYEVKAGRSNYPMRYVSLSDAEAFCQWLSDETGLNHRLPTEQEWEMAAGWDPVLDKLWTYGFQQDTIDHSWCNYDLYIGGPTEVGYYNGVNPNTNDAKSYYGCYDMSGNLAEWTSSVMDFSGEDYSVLRGEYYWSADPRITYRSPCHPWQRLFSLGFRFVIGME